MQRSSLIYGITLGLMCIAIVVVGVLILRKRAMIVPVQVSVPTSQRKPPAVNSPQPRPITSYQPERSFQPSDPIPEYPQEALTEKPVENPQ